MPGSGPGYHFAHGNFPLGAGVWTEERIFSACAQIAAVPAPVFFAETDQDVHVPFYNNYATTIELGSQLIPVVAIGSSEAVEITAFAFVVGLMAWAPSLMPIEYATSGERDIV